MKKKSFLGGGILDNKISNPPAPAFAILGYNCDAQTGTPYKSFIKIYFPTVMVSKSTSPAISSNLYLLLFINLLQYLNHGYT
ncbi:hypothetical protein BH20BAC1_BH20BAC1_15840 [soil metagenome]